MTELAIVIVSWNVRALLLDALRTLCDDLAASAGSNLAAQTAIWVVDNASADGTPEAVRAAFPQVNLIASESNLGFAAGNNLALRALGFQDRQAPHPKAALVGGPERPRAVFLLNPDTRVQPGAVQALYQALFSLPEAGLVGARLSYGDGTFQHSAFAFPGLAQIALDVLPMPDRLRGRLQETRLNGRYPRRLYDGPAPFEVDHTLGATMMLRGEVIEQVGLLDEQYYMYVEEVDWAMRIRRAGWRCYVVPAAHVVHLEGRSTRQIRAESLLNLWTSRYRFYRQHYGPGRLALVRRLVRAGMRLRRQRARRAGETAIAEACTRIMAL